MSKKHTDSCNKQTTEAPAATESRDLEDKTVKQYNRVEQEKALQELIDFGQEYGLYDTTYEDNPLVKR